MPGEISRSYDPAPDDEPQEPRHAVVYDIDVAGEYPTDVLKGEIRRLRNLLNDCWDSAGLLSAKMTGQPYQAWEEPSDLLFQIQDLHSDAQAYREEGEEKVGDVPGFVP